MSGQTPDRATGKIKDVAQERGSQTYPPEFQPTVAGRLKARLGDAVGINQFGINHTILEPGASSALRHWHTGEDEFVLVLEGRVVLIDDAGEVELWAGEFAGFPAGIENGHRLENRSDDPAVILEVGSRRPGADTAHYPDDPYGPVDR